MVPLGAAAWSVLSGRRPGLPLKTQSRSFAAACLLLPRARRAIGDADVTITALEVETVAVSRRRAGRRRASLSLFPGLIERRVLRRDRSHVRLGMGTVAAAALDDVSFATVDAVLAPGVHPELVGSGGEVRDHGRRVLFVGRLDRAKGIVRFLDLARGLGAHHPDLEVTVVGDGPLRDEVEGARDHGVLAGRVRWTGAVAPDVLRDEFRSADLFVLPTESETYGLAALEALAAGLPVVTSHLPATREALGDAAVLLPLGRPGLWRAEVSRLLRDGSERERRSEAGRRHAADLTWTRAAEQLEPYLALAMSRAETDPARSRRPRRGVER